jgi:hypothetical protein
MNIANQILDTNDVYRECEVCHIDVYYDENNDKTTYIFDDGSAIIIDDNNNYRSI